MTDTPLASLSLTHVHYNPNDPLSFLSAWLALVPQALCVTYVTLIWATREVEVLLMFAGQMGCEALNFVLKRIIQEERPKQMLGKGYGMPSSHAQFVAYFAVYLGLFLIFRHNPTHPESSFHILIRIVLAMGLSVGAGAVAISRIYLNYHTPKQVLAGCGAGIGCAFAWFLITAFLRTHGWIDWVLDLTISTQLRLRDLVVSEDLAEAGWQKWEAKRKLKRRGHISSDPRSPKTD
ncbi:PAP2 superfamily protein [Aspergillus parasiticus SU-1]|uniref:Dolichyldiphosphatase n=3 Tax=Aspergillus subgen. Circumdati TaxID=2720871 RepID=A0A5N6DWW3_ASPPA|nr:phosphatidic acid phosphatase type 2/haloperoxidase [Aspergillus parasiticus]KAE8312965.1 phosphatidic acid phosphatase type 2/haloperoxidase [Aspergillus transmontanensis]KJK64363.1 PAP2 superfamily protein [Aspergillus parasiticus SU-1]